MRTYDPAYAYETTVIVMDGLNRMYHLREDAMYYITIENENYPMPAMPKGVEEGIIEGIYKLSSLNAGSRKPKIQLFGSGAILRETLRAQQLLAEKYDISSDVWSVTSYKELRRGAQSAERWNFLHPGKKPRKSYLEKTLKGEKGPFLAASDYVQAVPELIARWVPGGLTVLGTDGFGRSDTREALRRFL